MKSLIVLFFVAGALASGEWDDGQWRGEGVWDGAGQSNDGQWRGEGVWNNWGQDDGQWRGEGVWNSGLASPVVQDTPEVAAARAAHLAAHQAATHRWRRSAILQPGLITPLAHAAIAAPIVHTPALVAPVPHFAHVPYGAHWI